MLLRSVCLLTLLSTICLATSAEEQKRPPTPYGLLYKEWKAKVDALDKEQPELSRSEKRSRRQEISVEYTPRFLQLAQEHLDDDLWLDCLIWTSVQGTPGEAFDAMFDILHDNAHAVTNTPQLQLLMSEFIRLQSDHINPALAEIAENHGSNGVRGAALYALAARTIRLAEEQGDLEGCATARRLLERVLAEYPDVSTYRGENRDNATKLLEQMNSPVAISQTAPNIEGQTISGDPFSLSRTIEGRVAVISFSGHWCGPCVAMHPIQKEILTTFSNEDVVVVELNSDAEDSLDDVRSCIKEKELDWTVVPDGQNGPTSKEWRVRAWPTYFVIDADGRIRHRATGNIGRRLITWVEELLPPDE